MIDDSLAFQCQLTSINMMFSKFVNIFVYFGIFKSSPLGN